MVLASFRGEMWEVTMAERWRRCVSHLLPNLSRTKNSAEVLVLERKGEVRVFHFSNTRFCQPLNPTPSLSSKQQNPLLVGKKGCNPQTLFSIPKPSFTPNQKPHPSRKTTTEHLRHEDKTIFFSFPLKRTFPRYLSDKRKMASRDGNLSLKKN